MEQIVTLLNGRVTCHPLPVIGLGAASEFAGPRRLQLPRGELAQLHSGPAPIHYLACIEFRAGTQRGGHFHRQRDETIYILWGSLELTVEDVVSKARESCPVQTGDLIRVPRGIAHGLTVHTAGYGIEFAPVPLDPEDIFVYPIA